MKRITVMVDEDLLKNAVSLSGSKTYSSAVNEALELYVKRARARQILKLRGSGAWSGSLAEMRDDKKKK